MGFVQSASNHGSTGSSLAITLGSAPTSGHCLIGMAGVEASSSDTITSFKTGTSTDNWAQAVARNTTGTDGCGAAIWTNQGLTVTTTTINVAFGASGPNGGYVVEWAGVATSGAVDQTHSAGVSSSTSWSSGSTGTLSQPAEVAFGFTFDSLEGVSTTFTPPGAFTNLTALAPSSGSGAVGGYQQVSATTALTYNGTSSTTIFVGQALIATLELASGTTVALGPATIQVAAEPLGIANTTQVSAALIDVLAEPVTPGTIFGQQLNAAIINVPAQSLVPKVIKQLNAAVIKVAAEPVTPASITPELIISIAPFAGTDQLGNAYLGGTTTYSGSGSSWFATSLDGGFISSWFATSPAGPWSLVGQISFGSNGVLNLDFPYITSEASQFTLIGSMAPIPQSAAGITTVAQLVSVLQSVGILS